MRPRIPSWLLVLQLAWITGCSLGPVWAPRVAGRVVDAQSGEPIPGASVVFSYIADTGGWIEPSSAEFSVRTTTTDADGYFAFPGHLAILPALGSTDARPLLRAFHPAYARSFSEDSGEAVQIRMRIDEEQLDQLVDAQTLGEACELRWRDPTCKESVREIYDAPVEPQGGWH